MEQFVEHFRIKFSADDCDTKVSNDAKYQVQERVDLLLSKPMNVEIDQCSLSEIMIRKYIRMINSNSAPGSDGIAPNHLKYALDLLNLLNFTFFGCVVSMNSVNHNLDILGVEMQTWLQQWHTTLVHSVLRKDQLLITAAWMPRAHSIVYLIPSSSTK